MALAIALVIAISGCAGRPRNPPPIGSIEEAALPYSRNFIVALPTSFANFSCGLVSLGLPPIVWTCGAIVGAPFIPLSYLCPENPWYLSGGGLERNYECAEAKQFYGYPRPRRETNPPDANNDNKQPALIPYQSTGAQ